MAAQLIPIATWAERVFGEHAPHQNTLMRWVHGGKILPRPMKVGRGYFCQPDAKYVDETAERINRMIYGRQTTKRA
jgi:predicted site-specific integrase-resolvase